MPSSTHPFMRSRRHVGCAAIISSLLTLMAPIAALAQDFPSRLIKIVVPYPPGSSPDALARFVGEALAKNVNQTVVIENKPGAAGMIGAKAVAEAPADGYTLLMFTPAWPAQKVFVKKPVISVPDALEPVTLVAEGRFALTVSGALPAKTFTELVAHAKANPGKLNFATTGTGDALLYVHTLLVEKALKIETIQYKGSGEYLPALVANDVQMAFTPEHSVLPLVREGKLRVLAVTGAERSPAYPDVPTFNELGLPKIRNNWMSLFVPRGTPAAVVAKLNAELVAVIKNPTVNKRIRDIFFEPVGSTSELLRKRIQTEIDEWTALAKTVGIEPQ